MKGWSLTVHIKPGQDVREELAAALKECSFTLVKPDAKTNVLIALPNRLVNFNDLALAAIAMNKSLAVEGVLTATDDKMVIGFCGLKDTTRIPLLIAKTATWVDDKNKDQFPPENTVRIRGAVRKGEVKLGSETFNYGITNADGVIPMVLPKDAKAPENDAMVVASGRLRSVEGRPVVDVEKIDSDRK